MLIFCVMNMCKKIIQNYICIIFYLNVITGTNVCKLRIRNTFKIKFKFLKYMSSYLSVITHVTNSNKELNKIIKLEQSTYFMYRLVCIHVL